MQILSAVNQQIGNAEGEAAQKWPENANDGHGNSGSQHQRHHAPPIPWDGLLLQLHDFGAAVKNGRVDDRQNQGLSMRGMAHDPEGEGIVHPGVHKQKNQVHSQKDASGSGGTSVVGKTPVCLISRTPADEINYKRQRNFAENGGVHTKQVRPIGLPEFQRGGIHIFRHRGVGNAGPDKALREVQPVLGEDLHDAG